MDRLGGCDFEVIKPGVSIPALPPLTSLMTLGKGHILRRRESIQLGLNVVSDRLYFSET